MRQNDGSITCLYGSDYIGHTKRALSKRISDHSSVWLSKGLHKLLKSPVLRHLDNSGYSASPEATFKIIHIVGTVTAINKSLLQHQLFCS